MTKYEWVISDLDGTIISHVDNKYAIYKEVITSINEFIATKSKFTIATGRHYKDVISIINDNKIDFQDDFFIIGMNGGQIYSWGEKKLIYNTTLPNDKMKDIKKVIDNLYSQYLNKIIIFGYGENENIYIIKSNHKEFEELYKNIIDYENNQDSFNYVVLDEDELFKLVNISKFCIAFNEPIQNPPKLIKDLKSLGDDIDFVQTGISYIELMPSGVNKGTAIKIINENYYNFNKEQIMALGDSGNDIEMFKYASKSITRKSAPQYVKDAVTDISEDEASFFVKTSIEKWIFNKG